MREDAAALARRERHADELALAATAREFAGQAVEHRQVAVDVGEVRVDQVEHAAVLADDLGEEQFRLLDHGGADRVVEGREHGRIGRDRGQLAQLEPLQPEAFGQVTGARVLEQAAGLRLEVGRKLLRVGQLEEFVVGHRTPEEIAEARSQREFADRMRVLGRRGLILFGAEDEFRRSQHQGDHRLRAGFPAAFGLLGVEEHLHIAIELGGGGRTAEGAAHEGIRDRLGAGRTELGADDQGQAALEFRARVLRAEQAEAEAGERAGVAGDLRRRIEPLQREVMRAGREGHLGLGDLGLLHLLELVSADFAAVDEEGDLRGRVAGGARRAEADRDHVVAVARGRHRTREGRGGIEEALLALASALGRHLDHRETRAFHFAGLVGHRLGGDRLADGQEPLQMDRRERQHVADVVEAIARVVGREVGGEILVEEAEVADGLIILRAVEAADGHVARVGLRLGDGGGQELVDGRLEGLDLGGRRAGLLLRRGHLAGGDLVDDFAPDALIAEEAGVVLEGLEVEVALLEFGVVTIVAVLFQERHDVLLEVLGGGRRDGGAEDRPKDRESQGRPNHAEGQRQHLPTDKTTRVRLQTKGLIRQKTVKTE